MRIVSLTLSIACFLSCTNSDPKEELKDWDEIVLDLEVPSRNYNEISVDSTHTITKEPMESIGLFD
jgi:hypothetical protein